MFRSLFRRPRTVNLPARTGSVEMQRVEIKRQSRFAAILSGSSWSLTRNSKVSGAVRRFALNTILFYCAFHTIKFWIYGPDPELQKKLDERRKQQEAQKQQSKPSDHWKQQHDVFAKAKGNETGEKAEQSSDKLTIPIYGWMKELDRKLYKASDPEWKAFEALQKDQGATRKLYKEFDAAITKQIKSKKSHLENLAYIKYSGHVGRDLNLQLMIPPPSYAVRCVVFEHGKVTLAWKELEHLDGTRMQRLQQPLVLTKAFFNGLRGFTTTSAAIVKARILDNMYPDRRYTYILTFQDQKAHQVLLKILRGTSMNREERLLSELPLTKLSEQEAQKAFPFLKGSFGEGASKERFRAAVQSVTQDDALQYAVAVFKRALVNGQLEVQKYSTPGAVSIVGHYDFIGDNGRYRVQVLGRYLPREDAFIGPPLIISGSIVHSFARPKTDPDRLNRPHSQAANPHARPEAAAKKQDPIPEGPEKDSAPGKEAGK